MKDATIEIISEVKAHPNADRLDIVKILGFQCVAQKGLYKGGEKIVYIRPDSVLPFEKWTEEYRKYSPKRVKAVKLRGIFSEGIIVPFEILPIDLSGNEVGMDVSEIIGVIHYEPPAPQDLQAKGGLPKGISVTDEERFENLIDKLPFEQIVDVTLKIDGQSCSYYYDNETDEFGVLGRRLEMKQGVSNNYTAHIDRYNIKDKLIDYCKKHNLSLCIRGESYGQGIQGLVNNPNSQQPKGWAMFSVYDIKERKYYRKGEQHYFKNVAQELDIPHVEILEEDVLLTDGLISHYSFIINKINGKSFEGVVVNHSNGTFKIINKDYDSKK